MLHMWAFSVFVCPRLGRGRKERANTRIPHPGSKAQGSGIPDTMVCRILGFRWPFGPLLVLGPGLVDLPQSPNGDCDCARCSGIASSMVRC